MKEALNRSRDSASVTSWSHRCGVLKSTSIVSPSIDINFVHCFKKRAYQCRLLDLLDAHLPHVLTTRTTVAIYYVSLEFFVIYFTFVSFPLIAKPEI